MKKEEAKKLLKETRELSKGTMPIIVVVNNKEEYNMMSMVKKEMRNVKNIELEFDDTSAEEVGKK